MLTPINVIGHVNPDTDSIAAAIGYAWLLRERDGANAIPSRAGAMNAQSTWVLKTLGIEAPVYLADASPRFERIARTLPPILPNRPLREAWEVASGGHTGAPIVEADGTPLGLITGNSVFRFFSRQMEERIDLGNVSVARILSEPCGEAADQDVPRFTTNMRVRDGRPRVVRDERDDFLVVDENGKYYGICRSPDVLNPPRMQIILVDHNESAQALGSLDEADLIEVLDHHRLGNSPTRTPIPFTIDPVGSTSTLVGERVRNAGVEVSERIAGLLLAGILSDTLIFKSPTTTPRDKAAAIWLAEIFLKNQPANLSYQNLEEYGRAILSSGTGLAARELSSIITSDLKLYESGSFKFAIAQVEVPTLLELAERLHEIQHALDDYREAKGLALMVLMVTDVVRDASRLVISGESGRLEELPYTRLPDGTLEAVGVVSRKKQLLPVVLDLLQ
ncbi:MAG: DHH family phosphoesterase [Anaerolineae bacterium]|nr:DHH family phosphoesterase [Anaerolineae bacterium]